MSLPTDSIMDIPVPEKSPPSSPGFHGFGPDTFFPRQLVLETKGEGDEEEVVNVYRRMKTGRPGDGWEKDMSITRDNILDNSRRPPPTPVSNISSPTTTSKTLPVKARGSLSRPQPYLLDKLETSFGFAKLPKTGSVLSVFLSHLELEQMTPETAAQETFIKVKEVWKHHFGMRVIMGYDSDLQQETLKMITSDGNAKRKIISAWKSWKEMEKISRRPDRASKDSFKKKEVNFVNNVLDMPFNIAMVDHETILKEDSGITDWREDLQHLHNQLQREQIGTCDRLDFVQKLLEKLRADAKKVTGVGMDEIEEVDDDEDEGKNERNDKDFVAKTAKKGRKKKDVMGPVSATADRLGLSFSQRTMMAVSVANTLGVDLDTTNINKTSAWNSAQKERLSMSKQIKEHFMVPDHVVVHWDGKILKVNGNLQSNRVCVYITGVTDENTRKLLGVPETRDGTGAAEADVVKSLLTEWNVRRELCGMVFDTTSSNSGAEIGACKCLEDWLETPILWLACRHHVQELHLKRVVQSATGQTKEPGMALFKRLKSEWHTIKIDYRNLNKLNLSSLPEWMQEEGRSVLAWALRELEKNTWPRADYKELLCLTIICLGGFIPGFQFMMPGPDHHACWMSLSKCLYCLKLFLLLNAFKMSEVEKAQVEEISTFVVILYVKAWFQSPLPTAAARNDLTFLVNMSKYRLVTKPKIAMDLMQSCYRHLWYLVPQTVVFALADPGLTNIQKESMATKLHSLERKNIGMCKPMFPFIDLCGLDDDILDMSSLVTCD